MATTIKIGNGHNAPNVKSIQLDATAATSDANILAELAAYDAAYGSAVGSLAYTCDYELLCNKKNDGSWLIIRG